ncbi:hypothetical protein [Sandarakinorhabdus sp. AAP62]|uniref:hypothetical protein n=1 Tax=Sandarakinorhabdus sp. AAP62 TaxID=1248916 RepID=UPI000310BD25|nr:hypothetical protein [Sandarakinorhabdus sp. AAP62]
MVNRRIVLALPLFLAVPTWAQPADALAAALVACWQARGIRFTVEQVAARIGGRTGREALLAVAGAAISADEDEVETAVEILWEAGATSSPAAPLMARDLGAGLPLLLITGDGRALLLHAVNGGSATASEPLSGQRFTLLMNEIALIGRPVIAGA